jgi:hypothetical protein
MRGPEDSYHSQQRYGLLEPRDGRRHRSRSRDRHVRDDSRRRSYDARIHDKENHHHHQQQRRSSNISASHPVVAVDERLAQIDDDPRATESGVKLVKQRGGGRNTASFDPASTLVRPAMRIIVEKDTAHYPRALSHDDVVIVPDFLCKEDDWSLYYQLIDEMRASQAKGEKGAEWISWHEGAHLISKNPAGSAAYQMIQEKIAKYFDIPMTSVGTRFNWYRDSSDWKPYHHDSAAFNPTRGK